MKVLSLRAFNVDTLPDCDTGRISFISTSYANQELTYEFLCNWFFQLYRSLQLDPELLFVNEKGRHDLQKMMHRLLMEQAFRFSPVEDALISGRFANPITGHQMHIAILPTLPDGMMLVGDLVIGVPDKIYLREEKERTGLQL